MEANIALCIRCHQPICFENGQWKHIYHDCVTAYCVLHEDNEQPERKQQ